MKYSSGSYYLHGFCDSKTQNPFKDPERDLSSRDIHPETLWFRQKCPFLIKPKWQTPFFSLFTYRQFPVANLALQGASLSQLSPMRPEDLSQVLTADTAVSSLLRDMHVSWGAHLNERDGAWRGGCCSGSTWPGEAGGGSQDQPLLTTDGDHDSNDGSHAHRSSPGFPYNLRNRRLLSQHPQRKVLFLPLFWRYG